jgi:hypothetical protein
MVSDRFVKKSSSGVCALCPRAQRARNVRKPQLKQPPDQDVVVIPHAPYVCDPQANQRLTSVSGSVFVVFRFSLAVFEP